MPTNRLVEEKSPYLQQHAHNPVDWYPWGEEAFTRARAEDKPIFLSVGYSTCHWCHVMERESFENEAIAALMNEHFVNIKVDREERPDVDRVYMTYVQAATGRGGWPMSVWLTPTLEPFVGGTYFPPEARYGQPGFAEILGHISSAWRDDRAGVADAATQVMRALSELASSTHDQAELRAELVADGLATLQERFDPRFGGFGSAPKFPQPVVLGLLAQEHARGGEPSSLAMLVHTLDAMSRGGIHDHLGGGFHRYSVDRSWHVPHFEKMLYDQAQLANSYLDAFQLTREPRFATVARSTLDYVLRDLTDAESGAFYSAEDADSAVDAHGGARLEGAFYTWTHEEIRALLGDDGALFCDYYGVVPEGNADDPHGELTGKNVLHVMSELEPLAASRGLTLEAAGKALARAREQLFGVRSTRPRPHRDEKILCSWNGLMISAFARAAQVLDDERYAQAATRAADAVLSWLYRPERCELSRRLCQGDVAGEGLLDDYAFLAAGLLDLYQATFELRWLQTAEALITRAVELFYDHDCGGFFASSGADPSVLLRLKDDHDGAEPAGSSVATLTLLRLAALLDRPTWLEHARQTLTFFSGQLASSPITMPAMLSAVDLLLQPPTHVVIVGEQEEPGTRALLRVVHERFLPGKAVLLVNQAFVGIYRDQPQLAAMHRLDGQPTAHVCYQRSCQRPVVDPQQLAQQLETAALRSYGSAASESC